MADLAWTPFDSTWTPLGDSQRASWDPEQVEVYDAYTWRNEVRRTPASFGRALNPQWIDFPHITYISDLIADFMADKLLGPNGLPARRLILTMPPRHGKSFLLSQHVPAWYLTMFPDRQVILTTYEAEFAASWGGKVRNLIDEHGQKFGIALAGDSKAKNRWSLARPHLGGMITAGMGGPITGMGGGLLIGDDWVKNSNEANSELWRNNAWDWFNTTFKTRAQKDLSDPFAIPPKMLLLMTRWHDDDPLGRLLTGAELRGDTVVIHLPAIAMDNDPLGRERGVPLCPQIMDLSELQSLRMEDPRSFDALYQGDPTPEEGGLFSKSAFRYWSRPVDGSLSTYLLLTPEGGATPYNVRDCRHFITVDLAISEKTSADFSVFGLYALTPDRNLILVRRFRERIEEADHLPKLQTFYDECQRLLEPAGTSVRQVGIEKQTYGLSLIKNANRMSNMPIRPLPADQDKFARAIPAASFTRNGKFYLPRDVEWREEFVSECTSFPTGKHDDQVDTFAYAATLCDLLFKAPWKPKKETEEIPTEIQSMLKKLEARNKKVRSRARNRL